MISIYRGSRITKSSKPALVTEEEAGKDRRGKCEGEMEEGRGGKREGEEKKSKPLDNSSGWPLVLLFETLFRASQVGLTSVALASTNYSVFYGGVDGKEDLPTC